MRVLRVLLAVFLALLTVTAARAAQEGTVGFQGEAFSPQSVMAQGRPCWNLADPEVVRLVSRTGARLNWSSDGSTLSVHGPIRQTVWRKGSPQVRVQGDEQPAPGLLTGGPQEALMEPEALFFALALKERRQGPARVLVPLVGEPRLVGSGGERRLQVPVSSAVRHQSSGSGSGTVRLRFPGCAFAGSQRQFQMDDVQVRVVEDEDVLLELSFPPNWQGETRSGLGLLEAVVAWSPTYRFPRQPVEVTRAEFPSGLPDQALRLEAQAPMAYYWSFEPADRRLTVDLPGVRAPEELPRLLSAGGGLEAAAFRAVGTPERPVLRFEGSLAKGHSFEFGQDESQPGALILKVGPAGRVAPAADRGFAATGGLPWARGTLVLDPGHGGGDPGCVNHSLGVQEKQVTLDVALRLRELLQAEGWTVVLTREEDRDVTWPGSPDRLELQARCDVANQVGADCFISLHCNASVSPRPAGTSIHWYKESDLELARGLEFALGETLGLDQDGLRRDGFYVLRHTTMPAVLVEMAFLSNPREGRLLADQDFRQRIAEGLAAALLNHISGRYARDNHLPAIKSAP